MPLFVFLQKASVFQSRAQVRHIKQKNFKQLLKKPCFNKIKKYINGIEIRKIGQV